MPHGSFVWSELVTPNVEQAKEFYAKTIGWKIERLDGPFGTYYLVRNIPYTFRLKEGA